MKQWLIGVGAVIVFGMACLSLCAENVITQHTTNTRVTPYKTPD